ncbi:hypothetical protein CCACVL1_06334 [Corchorus capsularis]|uniref:CCHC-type domain-containing protein n=1 Tax=Corchorus capsularis TaxID=210143 RepID=A0A1R3JG85_COCAP|nr:hypothetical protein CCACVL1_06334 [Corchorus capsularis]
MIEKDNTPHESRIVSHESRIIVQDNTSFPSGIILDDTNFPLWSQLLEMRIGARNKSEFLTAKEIWEAVAKTFYDGSDETQLFELNRRSFTTHQSGRPLSLYYNELIGIFQEIDARVQTREGNAIVILSLHKYMTRLRVHIFLAGLDPEFNQARSEILRKDPPLDLESCYEYVRKNHNQRQTVEEPKVQSDGMVRLASRTRPTHSYPKGKKSGTKGNNYTCTHCGEEGHSKQSCYEIIRYHEWWDFTKKPRKKIGQAATTTIDEEVIASTSNAVAAHFAKADNPGLSKTYLTKNDAWVTDTGATDHMTSDSNPLCSIRSSVQPHILTADGGVSPVTGEGSVHVSNSINLDTVLIVHSLSSKLLSDLYKMVASQYQCRIQVLQSNNGERKNRQILEVVRASLFGMKVPRDYWGEAVCSAAYLINRTPSRVINFKTPYQKLHELGSAPIGSNLEPRVFGCTAGHECSLQGETTLNLGDDNTLKSFNGQAQIDTPPDVELSHFDTYPEVVHPEGVDGPHENQDSTTSQGTPTSIEISNVSPQVISLPSPPVIHESTFVEIEPRYPIRTNRGIPKIKYDHDLKDNTTYPINNYTSSLRLSKSHALVINQLSPISIPRNDSNEIAALQESLATELELKDLEHLKYFLGIEVARSSNGISLCQRKYVLDLLAETSMFDCKPAETPIVMNHKLTIQQDQTPGNKERYQRLVGRLIYLSHTRPSIAYAVSIVSQFMHAPSEDHIEAVYRILRYLKSSLGKGLLFAKNGDLEIKGYTDADWAGSQTDRKSTSGLLSGIKVLCEGSRWRVGEGSLDIWQDRWLVITPSYVPRPREGVVKTPMKVVDLMDFDNRSWLEEKLLEFFCDDDIMSIMCLPVPRAPTRDCLIWNETTLGNFSVRSAYYVARITLVSSLIRRGLDIDDICDTCEPCLSAWDGECEFWPYFLAKTTRVGCIDKVICSLWFLWQNRNSCIYNQICRMSDALVAAEVSLLQQLHVSSASLQVSSGTTGRRLVKWHPPPQGMVKINVDASFPNQEGVAGLGVAIRDSNGDIIVSAWRELFFVSNSLYAEVHALLFAFELALEWGVTSCVFESNSLMANSLMAIKEIKSYKPCWWEGGNLIYEIRDLALLFDECVFAHVNREANVLTHRLARLLVNRLWSGALAPDVCNPDSSHQ